MNIKQAETATGITKQNIRFYEAQKLLHPARGKENDYRNYTPADLRTLKRIKILRKLGMSVPVIRQILTGEASLSDALTAQSAALTRQRTELDAVLRACSDLQHESIDTLDEDAFLARMEHAEQEGNIFMKIIDDFKYVAKQEAQNFTFSPNSMIDNASEFTAELVTYAKEHEQDLSITKESMYPEFTLDGIEYTAMRVFGRYGAVIACTPVAVEAEKATELPRRRGLRWLYRLLPLVVIFVVAFTRFPLEPLSTRLLLSVAAAAGAAGCGFLYYRNRA